MHYIDPVGWHRVLGSELRSRGFKSELGQIFEFTSWHSIACDIPLLL